MAANMRCEVWLVNLGYAAEMRPALVVSVPALDSERALVTVVPHTTSLRGTRCEISADERFLKACAFDAQNLVTDPEAKLLRRLGVLSVDCFDEVMWAVEDWLGLKQHH